jgi:hypothetical protein
VRARLAFQARDGAPRGPAPIVRGGGAWVRLALLVCVWLLIPAQAWADAFGRIPRASDGEGIKVGERSRFHGGFALLGGYQTNPFGESRAEGPAGAGVIAPTAWVGLANRDILRGTLQSPETRTERSVDYNLSLVANFRQWLSRDENLLRQGRTNVGLIARVAFLPGRRFSVELDEDLFRIAEPRNYETDAEFNFNRIDHALQLRLVGRPGGGRLALGVTLVNQLLFFENRDFQIARNDRTVNGGHAFLSWRFLPKTQVYGDYSLLYTFYINCCTDIGRGRNEDNFAHRIVGGVRGQLLKRFVLDASAGWGLGFYRNDPNGPNFGSFIGRLSLDYYPTTRTRLTALGERRFQDSLFGNFLIDNGGGLDVSHAWRWRMITTLSARVYARTFNGLPEPGVEDVRIIGYEGLRSAGVRADTLFTLRGVIEQPLGRIWSLLATYDLTYDQTPFVVIFDNRRDTAEFIDHRVLLFAAVRI